MAAAVTVLFVLSAVVAVRGWPGIDPENDVPRVTLAEATVATPALGTTGTTPLAVARTSGVPAPIVLGAPSTSGGDLGDAPRSDATPDPRRSGATPGSGTAPSGTSGATAPSSSGTASSTAPAAPSAPSADPVADTIRESGENVGGTTDPVAPGTGPAITEVTDTVADTVDGTEQAVRDTGAAVEKAADPVGGLLGGS